MPGRSSRLTPSQRRGELSTAISRSISWAVRASTTSSSTSICQRARSHPGRSLVKSRSWVDGFVGARIQYPIAPQWSLVGYADLGGGGSNFTWQGIAGVNYAISPTMTARFGYRYLKIDYHRSDFLYNMATGGFYAGIGMRC